MIRRVRKDCNPETASHRITLVKKGRGTNMRRIALIHIPRQIGQWNSSEIVHAHPVTLLSPALASNPLRHVSKIAKGPSSLANIHPILKVTNVRRTSHTRRVKLKSDRFISGLLLGRLLGGLCYNLLCSHDWFYNIV